MFNFGKCFIDLLKTSVWDFAKSCSVLSFPNPSKRWRRPASSSDPERHDREVLVSGTDTGGSVAPRVSHISQGGDVEE